MKIGNYLVITLVLVFFSFFLLGLRFRGLLARANSNQNSKENIAVLSDGSDILGEENEIPKNPVFLGNEGAPLVSAYSVLAIDKESNKVLYEKNPQSRVFPASTTKLTTALVAFDYYPLDQEMVVGDINVEGQKMHLAKGEKITVRDIMYGLLMFSANDAAKVLATNFPGGEDNFVSAMNLKVKQLGLTNTSFDNPVGFDGIDQYTTAGDLIEITKYAIENPVISEIIKTKNLTVKSTDGLINHKLVNLNQLLGEVDGVLGVKTGWTESAKENLVTFVDRDGKKVIIALLGSNDRFGETKSIINWIYNNYSWD